MFQFTNFSIIQISFFSLKGFLISLGFLLAVESSAKIYIENYYGWSLTSTNSKPFKQAEDSNKYVKAYDYAKESRYYGGISAGLRVGYSSLGLAVGVDFALGRWSSLYRENFRSFKGQEAITPFLPGLFVSYKLPLLFRAYAVFIPKAPVMFEQIEPSQERKWCQQSTGGKIGVTYLTIPFVSVNLEYMPLYIGGTNCGTWSHSLTAYFNLTF